jgi:small subunit ribosomal protein S18
MARNTDRSTPRRGPKDAGRRIKKKPCAMCRDRVEWIDYKDVNLLRKYMSDRGKIRARRVTGNCAQHQSEIAMAIKTARELILLPYTQRTMTERTGGRGGGGRGGPGGGRGGPGGPRGDRPERSDSADSPRPTPSRGPGGPRVEAAVSAAVPEASAEVEGGAEA